MDKQEIIKELYFNKKYSQIEIAKTIKVSTKYVSKVLLSDYRYEEEKNKRKLEHKNQHRKNTIDYINKKREKKNRDVEYERMKLLHYQDVQEISERRKTISNRIFRNWNSSIYLYDESKKSYILKKGIIVGYDVPKCIKWKNY